ncbi:MAG: glutamine-hydrolyzing carbamoyl-phosphate synthase small subunit [Actinobacteria bacterium]|nr:glutamine-hydrolyzing carbamoyl-phosphate synthase small subunit [Actinomycetota bacterium]MBL7123541.1 glutamine-hydrolyzing carbamoyl-phosphate synthase small subunit [Actinomycetota bacterium]
MKAILMLEDGKLFKGINIGCSGETIGEVVFNTSMIGYQEILTDPSYCEQIVTMTYPQIGNYGVNSVDVESDKIQAKGLIVKEFFDYYSNWRAEGSLGDYIKKYNIIGLAGIDTRQLTRHIRLEGAMKGIISTETEDESELKKKIEGYPSIIKRDLVKYVTCDKPYIYNPKKGDYRYIVVAVDFGVKMGILKCLDWEGFRIIVVPASTKPEEILKYNPDGIFLSNGPGDPAAVNYAITTIKELIGKKPIFGICLGHQLLAIALGAKTYKLKFGHHGGNHPVKNLETGKVEITSQNHGFAVDEESLKDIASTGCKVTHLNLNDNTIEGLKYVDINAYTVQNHPEGKPGPHDSRYVFSKFTELIKNFNN